jgi:hypothetical protein
LAAFASLALVGCSRDTGPCFGLELNHPYGVTVEERYDSTSQFTYTTEIASDPGPSCGDAFRIPAGTKLTMTVIKQMSDNGCAQSYATVEGIPDVTFVNGFNYDFPFGQAGLQAAAEASLGACLGELRILIDAPHQQSESGDLFRRSQPGQVPEVVMQAVYKARPGPSCTMGACGDYYVVTVSP